ncbi:MAG: 2,3-bisphosphoglycerate-independent phosphoglycerate mutase [Candidatus Sumerlaeia bacterium]
MKQDLGIRKKLVQKNDQKIVMLVMDGVGGLRDPEFPQTELERANTPNLDALAAKSALGRSLPVVWGVTPGSGPGHLALFGYDPLEPQHDIGRGVLEAVGIEFDLKPQDVAARGNFCTLGPDGAIVDRRAGRLATAECVRICEALQKAISTIDGVEVFIRPVKDYRFVLVLRGAGLGAAIADTDPQQVGKKPLPLTPLDNTPETQRTIGILNHVIEKYMTILAGESKANGFTLRGFSKDPGLEKMDARYGLNACAIATYPLYRGVAKLVGMDVQPLAGDQIRDEFDRLEQVWTQYDFFFIHIKKTDSNGEDGNREGKIKIIEEVDAQLPRLTALQPDVIIVTGDHSTPPAMKSHSWHPVPVLIWSRLCDSDAGRRFTEAECDRGSLGVIAARELIWLALANAQKLKKFGA